MLTEQAKKEIDGCVTRSDSVWSVIKEISIKKYDNYLEALGPTCTTSRRQNELDSVKSRWSAVKDNETEKLRYLSSNEFDDDLSYVLKAVGQRLHGLSSRYMNIAPYMNNWRTSRFVDRKTAFKISVAFGFDIEETRKLLFRVLPDDEQYDFDPRQPNEMIYAYAIIHNIPLTSRNDVSVESMLSDAQKRFLTELFGAEHSRLYPDVIKSAGNTINVLDSLNMTKLAYILAVIKLANEEKISLDDKEFLLNFTSVKTAEDDSREGDTDSTEDETNSEDDELTVERMPKLFPDDTVMQQCYEYVSEDGQIDFRPYNEPIFDDAQISKEDLLHILETVDQILDTAISLAHEELETTTVKIDLYSTMKQFLQECIKFLCNTSDDDMVSIIDLLPLLETSGLGRFRESLFNDMIRDKIIKKLEEEYSHPRDTGRSSQYHNDIPQISKELFEYSTFFFNSLKVAARDLRAITARDRVDLWPVYVEMNNILKYPYFDKMGAAIRIWDYEQEVIRRNRDDEYTYTVDKIERDLFDAENAPDPSDFVLTLLDDPHCYEYFNSNIISQGKQRFVSDLDKNRRIIMNKSERKTGDDPLFVIKDTDGSYSLSQNDQGRIYARFYKHSLFIKQYYEKAKPFKRRHIIKLAFWDWILNDENRQKPQDLRGVDFTMFFDKKIAERTCCSPINSNNSLDKFLLLCLEQPDPIQFLKEADAYNDRLYLIF